MGSSDFAAVRSAETRLRSDAARHRRVQRRLLTGQSLMRPRAWSDLDGQTLSFLQAMQLLVVLVPLELSVYDLSAPWTDSRFAKTLAATPWPTVLAVGGGCGLVNALLLAGKLRRETPAGVVVRPWLRALGLVVGGVPVLWLSVVTGWDGVRARRPSWAFTAIAGSPTPDLRDARRSSRSRPRLGRRFSLETLKFVWLFFVNPLVLGLVGLRLSLASDPSSRRATLGAVILAHVLICIDLIHYQAVDTRRYGILGRRGAVMRSLPLLFLLPLPLSLLGLVMLDDRLLVPRASTLITAAYRNRLGTDRVAAWSRLQRSLDQSSARRRLWQRVKTAGRTPEPGVLGERLTRLYRMKTALLAGDALAFGWLLNLILSPSAIAGVLDRTFYVVLRTAGAGYLLALGLMIARAAGRARESPHVYGPFLAASHFAFLVGLFSGALIGQGRLREAGLLIAVSCACAAIFAVISGMLGHLAATQSAPGAFLWAGFWLAIALVGGSLVLEDPLAPTLGKIVLGLALLSPLWHAALSVRFASSLLYPFDVRGLCGYPRPIRRTLGVLAATLALPLGGLAVPYWIYVRRRHWPAYERRALSEAPP